MQLIEGTYYKVKNTMNNCTYERIAQFKNVFYNKPTDSFYFAFSTDGKCADLIIKCTDKFSVKPLNK